MENKQEFPTERGTGFEVVRQEYFSHCAEPSIAIDACKMWVNTVCLKELSAVDYVHIMVDREAKSLALAPSERDAKDVLLWCNTSKGKRRPRQISCRYFSAMLFELMNWNLSYRYKILGKCLCDSRGKMLLFDLLSFEAFQIGAKQAKMSSFPMEWKGRFGLPAEEHQRRPRLCFFEQYTVWELEEGSEL